MNEPAPSSSAKPILALKTQNFLTADQREVMGAHIKALADKIGAEPLLLEGGLDMSVVPTGLDALVAAMQASVQAQSELSQAIRRQADAIADLAEAVTEQQDEGDEPEGLAHLGTL